jgi:ribosomal protein S8
LKVTLRIFPVLGGAVSRRFDLPAFARAARQSRAHHIQCLANLVFQGERGVDDEHAAGHQTAFVTRATANGQGEFEISLKYYEGTPVIREVKRVSKPGRRVYMGVKDIPTVRNGLGISIVSTPKGVMSDANARAANVGGEVLCTVF